MPISLRLPLSSRCAVCRAWDETLLCRDCVARHAAPMRRCARCAIALPGAAPGLTCGECLRSPPAWDAAVAAYDYAYPWDGLIASFKFHAALDLAPVFAEALSHAVDRAAERVDLPRPSWLLPVPLGPERLRERGFNQAHEIARRVAPAGGGRCDGRLLLRLHDTPHQASLERKRRAANVRGAFIVEPRRVADLRGAAVAVIDDVMTTGATAHEIATVLKRAGAASVQLWVVARTPRD